LLTEEIVLNRASTSTTENDIREALLELPNTGNSGITVAFQSASPDIYRITFSDDSAKDWDELGGTPIFTKRADFEVISSTISDGTSKAEDTWSSTRGWPVSCTFHEGRLWFGGSKSRPATLWGSRVGDFFNFKNRRSFDDESIEATLDTDQVNAIEAVFSNRSLQIFTSGGEFYVPASPITPETISVIPQSNIGTKRVRPVTLEGVTLFVQRTGRAIIQFVFINEYQSNQSRSISFLSPHLINNPIKMSVSKGTESTDANYVYILGDDGILTVFNTLLTEEVAGFTKFETNGLIKSIAVVDDELNLLIEREIDGNTVYYIEKENSLLNTDSSIIGTGLASDTLTGLDHLEGETVKVKADGSVQLDAIVSGGEITIGRIADTIEAGLEYLPVIKTLPLNINIQNGPNASSKKKIARVSLQIYESNGIIVNGQKLADKIIGQNQFSAPTPQTGIKRIHLLGWTLEAQVTITQDTPMPLTILNIGTEVKI